MLRTGQIVKAPFHSIEPMDRNHMDSLVAALRQHQALVYSSLPPRPCPSASSEHPEQIYAPMYCLGVHSFCSIQRIFCMVSLHCH
jgi:hypothetical protein